jgi:hypothetical protein
LVLRNFCNSSSKPAKMRRVFIFLKKLAPLVSSKKRALAQISVAAQKILQAGRERKRG